MMALAIGGVNTAVGMATVNPLQALLGALAMSAGIASAGADIQSRRRSKSAAESRPMAYAVLAVKTLADAR